MTQTLPAANQSIQKGSYLEFNCIHCAHPIGFSVLSLGTQGTIRCGKCQKSYLLDDPAMCRQLRKFEALCRQIRESEEILGETAVSVDVGPHNVKVPYKLLLTRLTSQLNLTFDGQPLEITFRIEPSQDCAD